MNKIIKLRARTGADDIQCTDGELANADFIFEPSTGSRPSDPSDPSGPSDPSEESPSKVLSLATPTAIPAGRVWAGMHRRGGISSPIFLEPSGFGADSKCVVVGDWLILIAKVGHVSPLVFARWNGWDYEWFGQCPQPPAPSFTVTPKALPPYCNADGDLPRFSLSVPEGTDYSSLLQSARKEFLAAVEAAGLHFEAVTAAACWRLEDGNLWQYSNPRRVGPSSAASIRMVNSETRGGVTYLTFELSRPPFSVSASAALPTGLWGSLVTGFETLICRDGESFPPVGDALREADDIFAIEGRLFAVLGGHLLFSSPSLPFINGIRTPPDSSLPTTHYSLKNYSLLSTHYSLIYLTASLRSAAGNGELPSLHAFCEDGIHVLTPYKPAGSTDYRYRDSQLLSRHVAVGRGCFAPMPDGTAFITSSGVMKVSGFKVSRLSDADGMEKLLYLYDSDTLLPYSPASSDPSQLLPTHYSLLTKHHYSWPETWVQIGGMVGRAILVDADTVDSPDKALLPGTVSIHPVTTRPLKLTDAFAIKRLTEVHAQWPDGSRLPVKVFGAMHCGDGPWRCLGTAPAGRMRLRGSGWRFFRLETVVVGSSEGYLLPTVRLIFEITPD